MKYRTWTLGVIKIDGLDVCGIISGDKASFRDWLGGFKVVEYSALEEANAKIKKLGNRIIKLEKEK